MRFSNREINGLSEVKEIVVEDIYEYMRLFMDGKYSEYIFRGEPANYAETISSGLREQKTPFIAMKNEFKREIYHRLSSDEKADFLAFAQHHWIPTNLIDFTTAPLVALYFACQPVESTDDKLNSNIGFVYLIDKNLIDITDLISSHEDDNFLERLANDEEGIVLNLYKKLDAYEKKQPERMYHYFKTLYDDVEYYNNHYRGESNFPQYDGGEYKENLEFEYSSQNSKLLQNIDNIFGGLNEVVIEYVLMLQSFLRQTIICKEPVYWLNCMPNFIYKPYLSFDRGRNQQGLFIYQAYLFYTDDVYNADILARQRVWPEYAVVIKNKSQILKQLDFIGINDKFVYGDYDNIAKYIKSKYSVKVNG